MEFLGNKVNFTYTNRAIDCVKVKYLCKIWGFHSGVCSVEGLLCCDTLLSCQWIPAF
jgi:hypothetical protein